ncbi:hypothetical protein D1007_33948 [Hordeum vulgare]|nr:hypothetical protein D1007_33948 [Hordeum vulgare]
MRFNKAVKQFSGVQLGHISKYKMEALLHMPYQLIIPMNLLEWLDQHIFGNVEPYFNHKNKVIKISKDMVDKIFNFPSGNVPFFRSDDPQVKSEVSELRSKYIDHRNKMPISKIEEVMLGDETGDGFIRSFTFYFVSTILCPASYCFGNMKFLYSLRDVSLIPTIDFGQLALDFMREESERHFEMIMNTRSVVEMNKPSHIGGCLPIWGIIYLDFVDFDVIENNQSTVDYSVPRISHIKNDDFQSSIFSLFILLSFVASRHISNTLSNVGPVNNAPLNPSEFLSVPHVEVINAMNVDLDDKVKPDHHSKKQARVEETTKEEPTEPKVENIVDVKQEEKNRSPASTHENFSTGFNENRSFIMISSSSSKDRVKCFQGTPIIIEDVSLATPFFATKQDKTTSECDASVQIQMLLEFCEQQDFSTIIDAEAGTSTVPNTIENKNRKKRAAKVQSPDQQKKLKISREHSPYTID